MPCGREQTLTESANSGKNPAARGCLVLSPESQIPGFQPVFVPLRETWTASERIDRNSGLLSPAEVNCERASTYPGRWFLTLCGCEGASMASCRASLQRFNRPHTSIVGIVGFCLPRTTSQARPVHGLDPNKTTIPYLRESRRKRASSLPAGKFAVSHASNGVPRFESPNSGLGRSDAVRHGNWSEARAGAAGRFTFPPATAYERWRNREELRGRK
jgi:hypothetical protein